MSIQHKSKVFSKKPSSSQIDLDNNLAWMKKLRQIRLKLFETPSLEKLYHLIKNELVPLCQVDSITIQKKQKLSHKKGRLNIPLSLFSSYYMVFERTSPYSVQERQFFKKITQSIDVTLRRIETYTQLQSFKNQWKVTFNAIEKPICLTDHQFNILSSNARFLDKVKKTKAEIFRKNCFSVFFGFPLNDLEIRSLKESKILKSIPHTQSVFEIRCMTFLKEKQQKGVQLIMLTDISEKIKMKKQISNLKEMAELGIITSSIAHDLNNPLSGIQALLNLEPEWHSDARVKEMVLAVERCQSIVKKLLDADLDFSDMSQFKKDKSLVSLISI